jgi:probable rRNA maturation factor
MNESFSIMNTTKGKLPRLPFVDIKNEVLGKSYELSLVIIGKVRMQKLNSTHRGKNYATDILSFPLSDSSGEMFINLDVTKRKAKEFEKSFENYLGFLFIHGLWHLKGYDHGKAMEAKEAATVKKFGF